MSRSADPALHTHVVISNLTRAASDGRWLSLASPKGHSPLYPHGKSAGVVFQAALRAGVLREFGLEFEEVRNGYADIKGFSRELIEAFSSRSREIANWMERHGVSSVAAAQTAAYKTRAAKDHGVDVDKRAVEWRAQAEPYGLTPETVLGMVREGTRREPRAILDGDLVAAVRSLELRSSHFDRRGLLWALADQLPEGADLHFLTIAVDRLLASDLIVRIHESSGPLDTSSYTTPLIAELEEHFIQGALSTTSGGFAQVPRHTVDAVLGRHDYLG
jgi:hypothetical protein